MKRFDLNGKVVFITGASGGIGQAVAQRFYESGANLVLTDISEDGLNRSFAKLDKQRILLSALDVTDMAATRAVVAAAVKRFGHLDMVFANAGIAACVPTTLQAISEDEFDRVINVDLFGVWNSVKASLPHILEAKGHILITASIYAFLNGMANAPYAASKAAVESLGRSLRTELAGSGATAGVLYPGWVATPIAKAAFGGHQAATELIQHVIRGAYGRAVQPAAIAQAVVTGVESRAARIIAPRRWVPMFLLRGVLNAAGDAWLERNSKVQRLLRTIEEQAAKMFSGSD